MAPPLGAEPHNPMPEPPPTELTYSHLFPMFGKRFCPATAYVPPHDHPRSQFSSMATPAHLGVCVPSPGLKGSVPSSQVSVTMSVTSKCVSPDEKSSTTSTDSGGSKVDDTDSKLEPETNKNSHYQGEHDDKYSARSGSSYKSR